MHPQFLRSPNLIRSLLSQNACNKDALELPHRFGILDAAPVHLQHELFELFFHGELSLNIARSLEAGHSLGLEP